MNGKSIKKPLVTVANLQNTIWRRANVLIIFQFFYSKHSIRLKLLNILKNQILPQQKFRKLKNQQQPKKM